MAQPFYSTSARQNATRQDVLAGQAIRLSPALITITDGRSGSPAVLRREVLELSARLLACGIRSFHVDINFDDYSGFGTNGPDLNAHIFTPSFAADLSTLACSSDAYVTVHLLTDHPARHLPDFAACGISAVCFQLDVIDTPDQLESLVNEILDLDACASPVIETVGTDQLIPRSPAEVRALLEPVLPKIGMLTLQAAGTATRSNLPAGVFARDRVAAYLDCLRPGFNGTIQIQGGITTATVGEAVRLGADFLVCGTQLFRSKDGRSPEQVIETMLVEAANALYDTDS